jgi:hypothetical protein
MLGFKARSQQAIFPLLGMTEKTKDFMNALEDMGGMTEEVAAYRLQSFNHQFKIAKNHMTAAALSMKSSLVPILEKLNETLKATGEWFENLSKAQKDSIIKWGLIVMSIGPILVILSFFIKLITEVGVFVIWATTKIWLLVRAVWGLGAALLGLSPIVLGVIAALLYYAAIAYVVRAVWKQNMLGIQQAWESLLGWFKEGLDWLTAIWTDAMNYLKKGWDWWYGVWLQVWNGFLTAWKIGLEWLGKTAIGGFLKWMVKEWLSALKNLGKNSKEFFKAFIAHRVAAQAYMTNLWKGPQKAQEAWAQSLLDTYDALDNAFGKFKEGVVKGYKVVGKTIKTVVSGTKLVWGETWKAVKAQFSEDVDWLIAKWKDMFPNMKKELEDLKKKFAESYEDMEETTENSLSKMEQWWQGHYESVGKKIEDYAEKTLDVYANLTDLAIDTWDKIGDNLAEMLMEGEVNWSNFAEEIQKSLLQIYIKAMMTQSALSMMKMAGVPVEFAGMSGPGEGFISNMAVSAATSGAGGTETIGAMQGGASPTSLAQSNATYTWMDTPVLHDGGWVGPSPLRSDERIIKAQEGELVIGKNDMRNSDDTGETPRGDNITIQLSAIDTQSGMQFLQKNQRQLASLIQSSKQNIG